jgi:hypothetical protein
VEGALVEVCCQVHHPLPHLIHLSRRHAQHLEGEGYRGEGGAAGGPRGHKGGNQKQRTCSALVFSGRVGYPVNNTHPGACWCHIKARRSSQLHALRASVAKG